MPPAAPPLLLLDVDGVLNAVTRTPDAHVWTDWVTGTARANGRSWPITFSPTPVARLAAWHRDGAVELRWLTTWGFAANEGLHELLGLPALEVAGVPDGPGSASELAEASLAGSTAAAPDALTGRWWKLDAVRRLLAAEPGRPTVWVDDELRGAGNAFAAWAGSVGIVTVGPDPATGLTTHDLDRIEAFLAGAPH